jgi:hypothetical protein
VVSGQKCFEAFEPPVKEPLYNAFPFAFDTVNLGQPRTGNARRWALQPFANIAKVCPSSTSVQIVEPFFRP